PLDHALDRDFPGEPAQRVEAHIAAYAQVYSVLVLNGRGVSVATLEAQLAGAVVSRSATPHRRIVVARSVFWHTSTPPLEPPGISAYFIRPHEGQAKVCPVATTLSAAPHHVQRGFTNRLIQVDPDRDHAEHREQLLAAHCEYPPCLIRFATLRERRTALRQSARAPVDSSVAQAQS